MTKNKSTKRALLSSILSVFMCVAMLIGTTFAWFTDTAKTNVNKILAGNLDVALEMKENGEWVSAEEKTLNFVTKGKNKNILWEPGCTYNLPELRIVNNANLALKYKVVITGINGDAKLNEVIDWEIGEFAQGEEQSLAPNTSNEFVISGTMKPTADNSYQDLFIDGISITVYAAQDTVEYDSNGNQYDEDAEYEKNLGIKWSGEVASLTRDENTPADVKTLSDVTDNETKTVKIDTPELLAAFAQSINAGNTYNGWTVTLEEDIDLHNINWTPIGTIDKYFAGNFDGQGHTVSNLTVNGGADAPIDVNAEGQGLFGSLNARGNMAYIQNLNIHNADIYAKNSAGAFVGSLDTYQHTYLSGQANVWNCKLTGKVTIKGGNSGGIAGSPTAHWAILTSYQNIVIDVDKGSYLTNIGVDGASDAMGGVGAVAAYSSGTWNITSNLDVIAKAGNVGGAFGIVSGAFGEVDEKTGDVYGITCTGDVIIKNVSADTTDFKSYGQVLGIWAPIYSKKYILVDTFKFTGNFEIQLTDGTVVTSNGQESNLVGGRAW